MLRQQSSIILSSAMFLPQFPFDNPWPTYTYQYLPNDDPSLICPRFNVLMFWCSSHNFPQQNPSISLAISVNIPYNIPQQHPSKSLTTTLNIPQQHSGSDNRSNRKENGNFGHFGRRMHRSKGIYLLINIDRYFDRYIHLSINQVITNEIPFK